MENGMRATSKELMQEIYQKPIAGVSERPAKISALPESEQDLTETDQALYEKFLDCWKNKKKKTDLNGLSMKMLRECFLLTEDSTIYQSSLSWTGLGTISNSRISILPGLSLKIGNAYTLSDILEDSVDEKYFLSREQMEKIVFVKSELKSSEK